MTLAAKKSLRGMLKALPFKAQFISAEARFPPALKTRTMLRLTSILAEFSSKEITVHTNLGIASRYDLVFPSHDDAVILFGRPDHYISERGALLLSRELTKRSSAFIDIGSHKGYYIFYVHEGNRDKPIYFFEPHPQLFNNIEQNVNRNHLQQVKGFKSAVGAESGKAQFFIDVTSTLQGSLKENTHPGHEVTITDVEVTTFDDFIKTHQFTDVCVKVDIENAEFDFLNGARQSMNHISYLVMEVLGPAVKGGFVKTMIDDYGFCAYYINDFSLIYSPDGSFTYVPPQYNWLFCRTEPDHLGKILDRTPFIVVTRKSG